MDCSLAQRRSSTTSMHLSKFLKDDEIFGLRKIKSLGTLPFSLVWSFCFCLFVRVEREELSSFVVFSFFCCCLGMRRKREKTLCFLCCKFCLFVNCFVLTFIFFVDILGLSLFLFLFFVLEERKGKREKVVKIVLFIVFCSSSSSLSQSFGYRVFKSPVGSSSLFSHHHIGHLPL